MKKTILLLMGGLCLGTAVRAQGLPKWAEKARRAVFSVITYTADNKILNTGNGFYIDESGTAVSDYALFKGADHAVVVTADGTELPVCYIMGANDMYDVVKFKTEKEKKPTALQAAPTPPAQGETVYLLPYSTQKATPGQNGTVARIDTIRHQSFYYTVNMQTSDKHVSCPVMNAAGQVVGMVQKNAGTDSQESYVIGIGYATALGINALSGNDAALNNIGIKKGLPEDEAQALVYLYMMSTQLPTESYLGLLNDFIARYPNNSEGYLRRATCYMTMDDDSHNALADADMKQSLDVASKKDEAYFSLAKLLYSYNLHRGDKAPYGDWGWEHTCREIGKAIALNDQPLFHQTEGDIYFAMRDYDRAFTAYEAVNRSSLASATTFYAAAQAKELQPGSDKAEVLALLDSAVATFIPPYGNEAAPYLYERARVKTELEKYREAVMDYNAFYEAMLGQVSAEFYITREQAEMKCRMFKQALEDVDKAVELEPANAEYWVEKGGVHLRVNQADEAIAALRKALAIDDKNAGAYRMLGYCQLQKGDKKEGINHLQKAVELGDDVAGGLLEKYK